jgi:hypothetical protein
MSEDERRLRIEGLFAEHALSLLERELDGPLRVHTRAIEDRDISVTWTDQQADLCAPEHNAIRATLDEIGDRSEVDTA